MNQQQIYRSMWEPSFKTKALITRNLSDWVWCSGTPQRSGFGPLLFLILMIGINRNTQNPNLGFFADNTRTWQLINTTHSPINLQTALDQIYIWAEDNMLFNRQKFELSNFGESARSFHYETTQGTQIEAKESVRDLWIIS